MTLSEFGRMQTLFVKWNPNFKSIDLRRVVDDMERLGLKVGSGEFGRHVVLVGREGRDSNVLQMIDELVLEYSRKDVAIDDHVRHSIFEALGTSVNPSAFKSWMKTDRNERSTPIQLHFLIEAEIRSSNPTSASRILLNHISLSIKPLCRTFNAILRGFSTETLSLTLNKLCGELYNKMIECGVKPDTYTFSYLLKIFQKTGDSHTIDVLFQQMRYFGYKPSAVHYNLSLGVLKDRKGPSTQIENTVTKLFQLALHEDDVASRDSRLYAGALNALSRPGITREILFSILDSILKYNIPMTKELLGSVLKCFVENTDAKTTIAVFERLANISWYRFSRQGTDSDLVDSQTCAILVHGLVKFKHLDAAAAIVNMMIATKMKLTKHILTPIVSGYCKSARIDDAVDIFRMMLRADEEDLKPDAVAYNALISGYANEAEFEKAIELVSDMAQQNVAPDTSTFGILISSLVKRGNLNQVLAVYRMMKIQEAEIDGIVREKYKVQPSDHIFTELIVFLGHYASKHDLDNPSSKLSPEFKISHTEILEQIFKEYRQFADDHNPRPIQIYDAMIKHFRGIKDVKKIRDTALTAIVDEVYLDFIVIVRIIRATAHLRGWRAASFWSSYMNRFAMKRRGEELLLDVEEHSQNLEPATLRSFEDGRLIRSSTISPYRITSLQTEEIYRNVVMAVVASFARFGLFHRLNSMLLIKRDDISLRHRLVEEWRGIDVLRWDTLKRDYANPGILKENESADKWFKETVNLWIELQNMKAENNSDSDEDETDDGNEAFVDAQDKFRNEWKEFISRFLELERDGNNFTSLKEESEREVVMRLNVEKHEDFLLFIWWYLRHCSLQQLWNARIAALIFLQKTFGVSLT